MIAESVSAPHGQSCYQVRFDWGAVGAARIADGADVIVWVDVLQDREDSRMPASTMPDGPAVIGGGLTTASAAARFVLDAQVRLGRRATVAIVAAGGNEAGGGIRFAVEDLLGAGAVVDALARLGLDHSSPEAAAACAAFTGLRGAVGHLVTACGSARELAVSGGNQEATRSAGLVDALDVVTLLQVAQR
ncbi:hypothetical protein [Luethyella okanaganae]|uniref:2-phosphosulfolactate phosphatase n=1 Tax=Luethyella okanaganae TaxID=69372 RepID=A0ABW1VJ27_9MICO